MQNVQSTKKKNHTIGNEKRNRTYVLGESIRINYLLSAKFNCHPDKIEDVLHSLESLLLLRQLLHEFRLSRPAKNLENKYN